MAQVTLTSSVQQAGRRATCPGETLIFTCNVLDDFALQWIAGNQIPSIDPISFLPNSQIDTIFRGDFTATLVSAIGNPNNNQKARFRSQLTVTVVEGSGLNGTQVTCNRQLLFHVSWDFVCMHHVRLWANNVWQKHNQALVWISRLPNQLNHSNELGLPCAIRILC